MDQLKFSKKHKIKEDRFIQRVFEFRQWTEQHLREITTTAAVLIVILLVGIFIYKSREGKTEKAQEAFGNAMLYYQSGDTLQAVSDLHSVIEQYAKTPYAGICSFLLANIYYNQNDYGHAEEFYKKVASSYKPYELLCGASLRSLGNCRIQQSRYSEAIAFFEKFVKEYPKHYLMPEVLMSLAECQLKINDVNSAKANFEKVIALFPQSSQSAAARNILAAL